MKRNFYCPICGEELDFITEENGYITCQCDFCQMNGAYKSNNFEAYIAFLKQIPIEFYLNKLIDTINKLSGD